MARAEGEQFVHGGAGQPEPAAAGEVLLDHLPPHRDGHPVRRLAVPGHRLDVEAPGPGEGRPREQQEQRHLAVLQGGEVAAGRDVHVVGAGDGHVGLGLAGEARDHDRDLGELDGLEGAAPAGAVAEQVVEGVGFAVGVAAPGGFDAQLAAQGEGVHPGGAGGGDAQPEDEGGAGGVRVGAHSGTGEGEVGHGRRPSGTDPGVARRSTVSKKVSRAARASAPPSKPCQSSRMRPTSS